MSAKPPRSVPHRSPPTPRPEEILNWDLRAPIGSKPPQPPSPWCDRVLGFRWVPYFDEAAQTWEHAEIGLTPEDLLHPREADQVSQERFHLENFVRLVTLLGQYLREIPGVLILADQIVDWQVPGFPFAHGPDLALFFNVFGDFQEGTFRVRDWGAEPRLAIELVSPAYPRNRENDTVHKVREYHRVGVPQYVVADVAIRPDRSRRIELIPYRWHPQGYQRQSRDRQRRVRLNLGDHADIRLGTVPSGRHQILALFDGETGEPLADLSRSQDQFHAERARADTAEARAEAERNRAEAERNRAEAERTRAEAAEARAALLLERLRRAGLANGNGDHVSS